MNQTCALLAVIGVSILFALAPAGEASHRANFGTIGLPTAGLFSPVRELAPDTLPNGVLSWVFHDNIGGHDFELSAVDSVETMGPIASPDFDIQFAAPYQNRPGNEAGIIPSNGPAVVVLFFGPPGSGFQFFN